MSSFQQKIVKHTKERESVSHIQGYIQAIETAQMLCLADKLHQSYYKYVQGEFGELRDPVQDLKKNKMTMIYQIDNVNKEIKIIYEFIYIFSISKISLIWRLFLSLPTYLYVFSNYLKVQ